MTDYGSNYTLTKEHKISILRSLALSERQQCELKCASIFNKPDELFTQTVSCLNGRRFTATQLRSVRSVWKWKLWQNGVEFSPALFGSIVIAYISVSLHPLGQSASSRCAAKRNCNLFSTKSHYFTHKGRGKWNKEENQWFNSIIQLCMLLPLFWFTSVLTSLKGSSAKGGACCVCVQDNNWGRERIFIGCKD